MKQVILIILLAFVVTIPLQADQVYKWVDAQGNVHYSDKPHAGAEKVRIAPPQSYSAADQPYVPAPAHEGDGRGPVAAHKNYTITIVSPQPESTIWNTRSVAVAVNVAPGLSSGDTVTFELDGKQRGPVAATSATFDDLNRGQHSVSAVLNTADGQVVKASSVTFYIREATVFHGKPPL